MHITLCCDDITTLKVDAIVNAANTSLLGGEGLDGAIHAAAGPKLLEACRVLGGCPTGQAVITPGYDLPAHFVIHTAGPIWQDGHHQEPKLLEACYRNTLTLAQQHNIKTIAFPAISCGVYGYPTLKSIDIINLVLGSTPNIDTQFETIVFCCFNLKIETTYGTHLKNL